MMAEAIDPVRSRIMRSVHHTKTKPEMIVRNALYAMGYRFRVNLCTLPGSPDIAFTARHKAIFVHGCFWHRHAGCRLASMPKTHLDYWEAKFLANVERDRRKTCELEKKGWKVMIVWQCETHNMASLVIRLRDFLGPEKYN